MDQTRFQTPVLNKLNAWREGSCPAELVFLYWSYTVLGLKCIHVCIHTLILFDVFRNYSGFISNMDNYILLSSGTFFLLSDNSHWNLLS